MNDRQRLGAAQTFPKQKSRHRLASISKQGTDPDKIGSTDDHSKLRVAQRSVSGLITRETSTKHKCQWVPVA
jgi:hypothetical protein